MSPDAVGLSERLLLRVPAVPEPRAEAEGRRPVERAGADLDEAEEGVVLDAALPQVLAGLPRRRLEPVSAFIVLKIYVNPLQIVLEGTERAIMNTHVFVSDAEHEVTTLEVNLGEARPVGER